jgi:hypothetical protein
MRVWDSETCRPAIEYDGPESTRTIRSTAWAGTELTTLAAESTGTELADI